LRRNRGQRPGVVQGVVRAREALPAGQLSRHDRANVGFGEAAARHDATDLLVFRAIDD